MEFKQSVITNKGRALMAKLLSGKTVAQFTRIAVSSQVYTDGQLAALTDGQLAALTSLANVKQSTTVQAKPNNAATVAIEGAINNTGLSAGYYINTIGVYATDPDEGEILYSVAIAINNGYMPADTGVSKSGLLLEVVTEVSNAANVNMSVNPAAVATKADIIEVRDELLDIKSFVGYNDSDVYGVEVDFKNKKFTRLAGAVVATKADIIEVRDELLDIKSFVGYNDSDVYGVEVDFKNKKFTRLAGAVNKTPGAMFDGINAFGGRKRCILADDGKVLAYYGEAAYTETGALLQAVFKNNKNYPIGEKVQVMVEQPILADDGKVLAYYGEAAYTETGALLQAVFKNNKNYPIGEKVQVMVEQPRFYYKVVPLQLEKVEYKEVNTIAITAGASSSGNVTINLDGKDFTVAVATGDDLAGVATKIRAASFAGWTTGGSGASVSFTALESGQKVTATFSGGTTGVTAIVDKTLSGKVAKGFHNRKARYYVSDVKKAGFKLHPAFIHNGKEKNFIYLSAYEGSHLNQVRRSQQHSVVEQQV